MGGKWREFVKTYCGEANLVQLFTTRTKCRFGVVNTPSQLDSRIKHLPFLGVRRSVTGQRSDKHQGSFILSTYPDKLVSKSIDP